MFAYGKNAANGIAAMSYLAERYAARKERVSSSQIAKARRISAPLIAKLLTLLAQEALVDGTPGPRGGYRLTKEPSRITLQQIVRVFERSDQEAQCPFGSGWCGKSDPCPLHDQIVKLNEEVARFLSQTTLAVFAKSRRDQHS